MSLNEKYEYISLIGEGYFSIVKRYRNRQSQQEVAVKELKQDFINNPEYVHWFRREVDILKFLCGHPNIINILDEFISDDHLVYVMPKATSNLNKFIKKNNSSLSVEEKLCFFDEVLEAIEFAHSKGILHRDINPNNVLIFQENDKYSVCVSDFGLGKNLTSESNFTRSEVSLYGQLYYVAPEQRDKLKNATYKSDIYSLGKLLYFILTGREPDAITSTGFSPIIYKATNADPDLRHQDILEFKSQYKT